MLRTPSVSCMRSAPPALATRCTSARSTLDLSPTKHVVFMLLAASLAAWSLIVRRRRRSKRHHHASATRAASPPAIEAMVLYIRNEVVLPNVGHHGEAFVPFLLTLFFFILFCNLLGLIPYGSTATGNISVTAMLAIITFIVVEVAGMRAQGVGYLKHDLLLEQGPADRHARPDVLHHDADRNRRKLTKPFALAIRLFANMTAGHIVVLALIGLIFTFQSWAVAAAPLLMAIAIMLLELFVAFLQAFIFTLLASVFIGQIREAHH